MDTNTPAAIANMLTRRVLLIDRQVEEIEQAVATVSTEVGGQADSGFEYIATLPQAAEDLNRWVRAMRGTALDGVVPSQVDLESVQAAADAVQGMLRFALAAARAVNPN